jgi:hypothetical protein
MKTTIKHMAVVAFFSGGFYGSLTAIDAYIGADKTLGKVVCWLVLAAGLLGYAYIFKRMRDKGHDESI